MRSMFVPSLFAAAGAVVLTFAAVAQAQETMSPLVKQMFDGGWPDKSAVEQLNKERLYSDALEAYMLTLPALNTIGMRDGTEAKFGKGYNVLPIWKDRMNAKTWVPTPNCDVIYSMSYLDLKETGPLVVNAPPDVIGMFTDFFQRTITDVGAIGPDRARGGLYLLLPAGLPGAGARGLLRLQILDLQRLPFLSHRDQERGQTVLTPQAQWRWPRGHAFIHSTSWRRAQADAVPQRLEHPREHDVSH